MPAPLCNADAGYALPPIHIVWHEIPTHHGTALPQRDGQGVLFKESASGVQQAAREKRDSLEDRTEKMMEILRQSPQENCVLWHDLEDERHAIKAALADVVEVYGTQPLNIREQHIIDFSNGKIQYIAGKPSMLGQGVNWQRHCRMAIFLGIGFRFNELIQAVHRVHRFLQEREVYIHLIYTEAERSIRRILEAKWQRYEEQTTYMADLIRQYGLSHVALTQDVRRSTTVTRQEVCGEHHTLIHNDCVEETNQMPTNSVDLIVTSIPFSTQYEYSPSIYDFGHTEDNAHFWAQMDFLTPSLLRILRPGRVMCIHVKDRITPSGLTGLGFQTVQPLHAEAIFHYQKHGFAYMGMKTIVTDVVRENAQTYRLGWSEQCKDGTKMGCGMPEYLLLFRKPPTDTSNGYGDVPVVKLKPTTETPNGTHIPYDYDGGKIVPGTGYSRARWQIDAHGFQRSSGNRFLTPEEIRDIPHEKIYKLWRAESTTMVYDYTRHVHLGEVMERDKRLPSGFMLMPPHSWHPDIYTDIARMRNLNMMQERKGQQQHLCPMAFDLCERLINQLSMPGETVFDPFAGLCTTVYCAIKLRRKGIGIELNAHYFADGTQYCKEAEKQRDVPTLFDLDTLDISQETFPTVEEIAHAPE